MELIEEAMNGNNDKWFLVENSFFFPSLSLLLTNLENHYLNLIIYAETNQNLDVKTNVWHVINLIFAGFFFFFFLVLNMRNLIGFSRT